MAKTKITITARITGTVLFEHESDGNTVRLTLEAAVSADANLDGANLDGANLARAYLDGANLARANLAGAYLDGAYLAGANLNGAKLAGAKLAGAEKLVSERPILQIGPIGSRCSDFVAYLTDQGLRLSTGCFFGSRENFVERLTKDHAGTKHETEYRAALAMIDAHAAAWMPVAAATEDAPATDCVKA